MKMAFIGDSLVSCTNETLANTWYDIASKKMGFEVVNNAAGGKLTLVMWGMFKMDVVDEKADGVFLCCGMNDILLDEPMSSIEENMAGTLDKARDAGLPIVILGIPPLTRIESTEKGWQLPSEFEKHNAALREYRQWLQEEAERRNLPVLDYEQVLSEAEKKTGRSMFQDGLHPNKEGYQAVAEAFEEVLKAALQEQA
ncbi:MULTISPECIES: GDSL-type esterase/lipase family protein [Acidaminococcus]|uniref:G-D-S-L family lipolytic protein n=1 Tax=Acidaminococcus fermentans TaxID=905 RepID=A0A6N7VXI9_ACIFE|nr:MULTISPECIES: GDSL-type esterase/lipase family protein [Acidaminococcus]MSS81775.1 G-D-S-L family lipolytic protein [Acidaminococcus fermentans]CDE93446.1 lipolytic protein G-D-S-L family [Acidaminococcus sp. CAG:542]